MIVLKNCELRWAFLKTPNDLSGKHQVDLVNLSKENSRILKDAGIEVRDGAAKDAGDYITAKSNIPVRCVDATKNPMSEEIKIGNGTVGNVLINPYDWKFKGKEGVGAGLQAIQVVDLIEYKGGAADAFDEVDGYTATNVAEPF